MRDSMKRLLRAAVLKPLHRRVQYVNRTHAATGRCRQSRFFSFPLNDPYNATAVRNAGLTPMPAAAPSAWAGTLPGVMAGKRPPPSLLRVSLGREADSHHRDLADCAEYAVDGCDADRGSAIPAGTWTFCRPAQGLGEFLRIGG